jgi:cellulose synthase/poly-beta-1,6-N-acetylglucosamine synthase-like glycosyltransferase
MRYALGGSIMVVLMPILIYAFAFGKFGIIWDFFVGALAYIFYFPTYAVVLPIYARCHLDDVGSASGAGGRSGKLR